MSQGRAAETLARQLVDGPPGSRRSQEVRACPEVVTELKRQADAALGMDAREALRIARIARDAGRDAREPGARAIGYHALAKAYHASGRYRAATRAYAQAERGYRDAGREQDQARVILPLVDALMHLGEHGQAERAARRARAAMRRIDDPVGAAKALVNLANLRHAQDRHQAALRLLERARPVLAAANDRSSLAIVDYNRANSYSMLARFDRSGTLYAEARTQLRALGLDEQVAVVDYNLAYDHFLQGRVHDARRLLAGARAAFRRAGATHRLALASLDEAEIDIALGRPASAHASAEEARRAFVATGAPLGAARASVIAAQASIHAGQDDRASALLGLAQRTFRRARHAVGAASCDLAMAGVASERRSRRERRALDAARVFAAHGLRGREATALVQAGSIALEGGHLEQAQATLARAVRIAGQHQLTEPAMRAEHLIARVEQSRGREARARTHQRRAIDAYEALRAGIRSDDDRLAFAADRSVIFDDALRTAITLGRLDEAFEVLERARARALVDLLAVDRRFTARSEHDAAAGRPLRRLNRNLAALERQARDSTQRDGSVPETLSRRIRQLLAERGNELKRASEHAPDESYALTGRPVATLAEVRAALGSERTLLTYYLDGNHLGVLLTTATTLSAHPRLARVDDLRRAVYALRFVLARPPADDPRASAVSAADGVLERLHGLLIAPLESEFGEGELVIAPPAELHAIPFHALTRRGRPLLAERAVSLIPSATVLVLAARREPSTRSALVVARADDAAPGIDQEAQLVAEQIGATVLCGAAATAAALRAHAGSARILHIAAHGVYEPDAPMLSGLELADGRLTVPELAMLPLDAALVTLSACDTAVGTAQGEEVLGVVRSLLHAGARAVVAGLWAVHDGSTTELMRTFYARVAAGASVTQALRTAALAVRAERPHPYHWAPFIAVGGDGAALPIAPAGPRAA